MEYLNSNIFIYTVDQSNKTILLIVKANQLLKGEITFSPIEGTIEVQGFYLIYGQGFVSLLDISSSEIKSLFIQQVSLSCIRSMIFLQDKNIFISSHDSGELNAWSASNNSLVNAASIKISSNPVIKLRQFNNYLLTGGSDGEFQIFNINENFKLEFKLQSMGFVSSIIYKPLSTIRPYVILSLQRTS